MPFKEEETLLDSQTPFLPSIEVMPFFETVDTYGVGYTIHRETGYAKIIKNTISLYIFWDFSCLEYRGKDPITGKEGTVGYVRWKDIPEIREDIATHFDFVPTRFLKYPRKIPKEKSTKMKTVVYTNRYYWPGRGVPKNGIMPPPKIVERPIKTREAWNDTEEVVFKLMIQHSIPLEDITLFFQDTESCIKERARIRVWDYGETENGKRYHLRIRKKEK